MFTVEERDRVRDRIIEVAKADPRIVSGAMVGSLISSSWGGDRWSDLDLTFALDDGASLAEVLADWTSRLEAEFGAVHLFDLSFHQTCGRLCRNRSTRTQDNRYLALLLNLSISL